MYNSGIVHDTRDVKNGLYSMCLVGVGVELELEHTSQQLTATRVILRLREHLKVPEVKNGNPSDSKAETIVEVEAVGRLAQVALIFRCYLVVL